VGRILENDSFSKTNMTMPCVFIAANGSPRPMATGFNVSGNAINGPMHCALGSFPVTNILCVKIANRSNIVRRFRPTPMAIQWPIVFFLALKAYFETLKHRQRN
jgi:hypothetical protein